MIKLVILADDLTGATDTGIVLAQQGVSVLVVTEYSTDFSSYNCDALVIDLQTRHLNAKDAFVKVESATKVVLKNNIEYIYKKVDSTMRGNIGAEIDAFFTATKQNNLVFCNAYPQIGRTVKNGICYVNGVEVSKTYFGEDALNPVLYSEISKIIRTQTERNCMHKNDFNNSAQGIIICDCDKESDFEEIVDFAQKIDCKIFAGSAGMLQMLTSTLWLNLKKPVMPNTNNKKILVVASSVNEVTLKQIEYARQNNIDVFKLSTQQKMQEDALQLDCTNVMIDNIIKSLEENNIAILTSRILSDNLLGANKDTFDAINISKALADITTKIVYNVTDMVICAFGGDGAGMIIKNLNVSQLKPLSCIMPGIALCEFSFDNTPYYTVTKAGGFGDEDIIMQIRGFLNNGI